MKAIGIILGVIVAGLAAYVIWGLVGGGTAYAGTATGEGDANNPLRRTAGTSANDKPKTLIKNIPIGGGGFSYGTGGKESNDILTRLHEGKITWAQAGGIKYK